MRARLLVLLAGFAFFLAACASPALELNEPDGRTGALWGIWVLAIGWMGILIGQMGWFANLVMAPALVALLFRGWIVAILFAGLAILVALNTFELYAQPIPANEGLTAYSSLRQILVGFYLWVGSMAVVLVGAAWLWYRERAMRSRQAAPGPG